MIDDPARVRRLLVLAAAAVALVAVSSGVVALAGNNGTKPSPSEVAATTVPVAATAKRVAATTAPVADQRTPFEAAVQALVEDGTIDQAQADVLRRQIDAGGIDPQELIDNGVLTAAQMQAVQARLGSAKQSLAAAAASQDPRPEKSPSTGSSTGSDDVNRARKEAAAASQQPPPPEKSQPKDSPATR
jgi:hypothetical protein